MSYEEPDDNLAVLPQKFLVIGIITSEDFQKAKYALLKLHKSFPKEISVPDIRPMLDVEWNEFITKYQRRLGNGLWAVQNRVVIFRNGAFLGDFKDLYEFIWNKWRYVFTENWYELASKHLTEYLEEKHERCRQLVYFTIAIDNRVIGSLLFELYNDVVPLACENFLNRCLDKSGGYEGTPVHRIVENSWVQCGGYEMEPIKMPCENYVVPHDRRGVLSMCNNSPHNDNSTQFFIALSATPWMNYKYVAFGQLIHGDDVLRAIEAVPTYYQAPVRKIRIVKCGEYKLELQDNRTDALFTADEIDQWKDIQYQVDILKYLQSFHQVIDTEGQQQNVFMPFQCQHSYDSIINPSKIKDGIYSLKKDTKSCRPFDTLPDVDKNKDEGSEDYDICGPDYPLVKYNNQLYNDDISPPSSDLTL